MSRIFHRILGTAIALSAALPALAQHEAGAAAHEAPPPGGVIPTPAEGIMPMLVSIGVFAAVFAVLSLKVWPQIARGLRDREQKIRSEIEAAERAQKDAKAALAEYEKNLANARAEAQKMLDDAKAKQMAFTAELKAKADVELSEMRDKARRDIEQAKRAAVAEIHTHATELATSIAAKILKREIGPQDQQRLVRESLAELQGVGSN